MLKELNHYENLGTPKYFWELFNNLQNHNGLWTIKNAHEYFFNRIIDGKNVFDGCLIFAESIGAVEISNKGRIVLDSSLIDCLKNERYLHNKLLERVFLKLENDIVFHEIFSSKNISYDIIYRSIQVSNSAFRFKYVNFKQLLVDFDFLLPHPDKKLNKLIINPKYRKLFDKKILPEIKRRKIGIDELRKSLEEKQIYGEEAEDFVVIFEKRRLFDHPSVEKIQKISEYDVAAGYDIVSYNDIKSSELDRFVEVKSFVDKPTFYWSRNEIDVARIKKDKYFLYLVDRNRLKETNFTPMIIQNPYESVLKDDLKWDKRVEKYFVSAY